MPDFPTEGSPPFINRMLTIAEWREYVAKYDFGRLAPSRLVLHHTYRPDETTWRGLTTMRGIQKFYAGKGWTAGPHIFTGPDGIWLATPMSQIGIHAGTGNGSLAQGWYSIGLEMVGYFDKVLPSGKVWEHSVAVMGELSRRLKIPPRQLISFHRDYTNQKSCPGWAVTKEWVWSQVEAYLNNAAPPPAPPPGPIGTPTPDDELLIETLLEEGYKQKTNGQGYNADWAFHQYALEHKLGMPMGPSARITVDGKVYNYQPFARDTLYCEVPNWGDVKTLSDLLGGSIPPSGLGRALLDATYQAGGSPFRPDWAFHQYAVARKLGPPVGKSAQITVDGKQYAYQAFAVDTLYNLVPNWQDVRQLSQIGAATDPATVRLRDALLTETYKQAGTTYRPDWAFHQLARQWAIGVPLANSYQITLEKTTYALQPFALDVLYNVVPKWSEVKRLSDLARQHGMPVLGAAMPAPVLAVRSAEIVPPSDGGFSITQVAPPAMAFGERGGEPVSMVVLHAIPGPAEATIAAMTDFNARFATHYLIGLDGRIYRLVDEAKAAWHAGFATSGGTRYNLNRISVGIALERPAGWPATRDAGDTDAQVRALRWLLRQLDARYRLDPDAIVLWSSLAGSDEEALAGLPLGALREALMG
ncbi:N-acetylmuramoyl-L-alanine amidase [Chloroflexus islandicus]|uniref:N-acetylmuramoyl-L-alanine amidase n=1 Tax=Chloroflexus islandicus TaxID=1707952 RepID=A0A178M659_9CHLR|nr:peptidoglycan recognition family protein [Chloroflexus islandicus]OAN44251.1 N-acetylmuramoyl-L-alanine amidase [Chloroflexus islandicus]